MKSLWTIPAALALVSVTGVPALADLTTAAKAVCSPDRLGRCRDGACQWKPASERDKTRPLVVDFAAKKAFIRRDGADNDFGVVLEDKVEGGLRMVLISRDGSREARKTMEFSIDKDGKLKGSRAEGRVKFEASCTAG